MGHSQQLSSAHPSQGASKARTEKPGHEGHASVSGSSSDRPSPTTGTGKDPSHDAIQLMEQAQLTNDTIEWLIEEGLGSSEPLKMLTPETTKELYGRKSPKLPFGQELVLDKLVAMWAPTNQTSSPPTATLVREMPALQPIIGTRPLQEILPNQPTAQPTHHEAQQPSRLQQSLNNIFGAQAAPQNQFAGLSQFQDPTSILNPKGKQPYLDIVGFIPGSIIGKERAEFPRGDGRNITIEAGPKRPSITIISRNQRGIANMRILTQLMANGSLSSMAHITNYLAFTTKIHQHAIRCTWSSIMIYDREYRQLQATEGFPWGMDNIHLQTVYLREKAPEIIHPHFQNNKPKNTQRFVKVDPKSGREVCISHNRQNGCNRTDCKYIHFCSICFNDSHNAINHSNNSKN